MQSSATTLGSFTLYRGAVEAIVLSVRQLVQLTRMAFQGVFLMGAFAAAMEVQPRLQPPKEDRVPYPASPAGMTIELRCACSVTVVQRCLMAGLVGMCRIRTQAVASPRCAT